MSLKIKVALSTLSLAVLIAVARWGYLQLHPVLQYVLDDAFVWCIVAVFVAVGVLALIFFGRIGRSNGSRAILSLLVVLITIFSSTLFGWVAAKIDQLNPSGGGLAVDYALSILGQVIGASSTVLSLGTAGIALALLIGTFPKTTPAD